MLTNKTLNQAHKALSDAGFIAPGLVESANSEAKVALAVMWSFATLMVAKHGMEGDDTMTDAEHKMWQDAAGLASAALVVQP